MTALDDSGGTWINEIYQIEQTDAVLGGAPNEATKAGLSNIPHLQLARRTAYLKAVTDSLLDGSAFPKSIAPIGWRQHADGTIEQWGYVSAATYPYTLVYPVSFPTACWTLLVTGWASALGHENRGQLDHANIKALSAGATTGFDWRAWGQ